MICPMESPAAPVQLAALECGASCVVAALRVRGSDYRHFLLGYWQTVYYEGLLMSARNLKWIDLSYAYGIRTSIVSGQPAAVDELLDRGHMAIVLCRASALRFFPPSMLGFESAGFYHCVLLHGRDKETGVYSVIDPVAGFSGEITADELLAASARPNELVFSRLEDDESYVPPAPEELFRRETARNLAAHMQEGARAIARFKADVRSSVEWETERRRTWTSRNNLTLSALARMRAIVWQSFAGLGLLDEEAQREGAALAGEVTAGWTNVNLRMVKYGVKAHAPESELAEAIVRQLDETSRAERRLLAFLADQGRRPR